MGLINPNAAYNGAIIIHPGSTGMLSPGVRCVELVVKFMMILIWKKKVNINMILVH